MAFQFPISIPCPHCGRSLSVNAEVCTCCLCGWEFELQACHQCGTVHSLARTTGTYTCSHCQAFNALYRYSPCPWCALPSLHVQGGKAAYCGKCQAQFFVDGTPNPPKPPRAPGFFGKLFGRKCPRCGKRGHVQHMGGLLVNQQVIYRNELAQIRRYENYQPVLGSYSTVPVPVPFYHNVYRVTFLCTACHNQFDEYPEEEVQA